jgi:hypothetical protein
MRSASWTERAARRAAGGLFLVLATLLLSGQRGSQFYIYPNTEYNGLYTFTRVAYAGSFGNRRGGGSSWSHDYPDADRNMSTILRELTGVRANLQGTNVFTLDDPEIFKYPILYISEPGYWYMNDTEEASLRKYIERGGFLIFDDFERDQINNLIRNMERVLPGFELIGIGEEHPIFGTFFKVDDLYIPHPLVPVTPQYWAIFVDNDPKKRMIAILNHDNDLAEYWEFSHRGFFPVDLTNEAYKIGVNEIIYALTH